MTDDRERILRMVAEGMITPEEGAELLEAVEPERDDPRPLAPPALNFPAHPPLSGKALVLEIEGEGDSHINIRVPLALALNPGFLPRRAHEFLSTRGINLQALVGEFGGSDAKGTLLEIEDGEDRVYIGVK